MNRITILSRYLRSPDKPDPARGRPYSAGVQGGSPTYETRDSAVPSLPVHRPAARLEWEGEAARGSDQTRPPHCSQRAPTDRHAVPVLLRTAAKTLIARSCCSTRFPGIPALSSMGNITQDEPIQAVHLRMYDLDGCIDGYLIRHVQGQNSKLLGMGDGQRRSTAFFGLWHPANTRSPCARH
jgi:hypothetical protein